MDKVDRDRRDRRIRESNIGIGKVKRGYQERSNIIKHIYGTIKVQEEMNRAWKEYFQEVLNREEPINPIRQPHI